MPCCVWPCVRVRILISDIELWTWAARAARGGGTEGPGGSDRIVNVLRLGGVSRNV